MTDQNKMVADALRGSWVHKFLPERFWPYAQLARWERPIGWKLLMWPCWWSAAMALSVWFNSISAIEFENLSISEKVRWFSGESIFPYFLLLFFLDASSWYSQNPLLAQH